MEDILIQAGLSQQQAQVYLYIIDHFPASPGEIATALKLSRTNAYKVADKLVEQGLAKKEEENKKIVYLPTDPIALSSLVAETRNKMIALERATKEAMKIIKNRIAHDEHPTAQVYTGRSAIVELFKEQASLDKDLYFIATPADLPVMSFHTMHMLRNITGPSRAARYGLTPDIPGAVKDPAIDKQSRLVRTWLPRYVYESPVEWSVCDNELRMFIYADEPYAIKIADKHVADAFRQLWKLLDEQQRASSEYKKLPQYADRTVWSR